MLSGKLEKQFLFRGPNFNPDVLKEENRNRVFRVSNFNALLADPLAENGAGHWTFDDHTFKSLTSPGMLPISVDPTGNGVITTAPGRTSKILQCTTEGCMHDLVTKEGSPWLGLTGNFFEIVVL